MMQGMNRPYPVTQTIEPEVPPVIGSREIAVLTGRHHSDVLEDIVGMFTQLGEDASCYAQNFIHPQTKQHYREYRLAPEHLECLISGYSAALRMKIIRHLKAREVEAAPVSQDLPDVLRLAAAVAEQNRQLTQRVQLDAHKVAFVEHFVDASGTRSLRETAKILNMPEKVMIDALIRDKILFRQSGNLLPAALRQRDGLFSVKTGTADSGHAFSQTRVTPKGLHWIAQRYAGRNK